MATSNNKTVLITGTSTGFGKLTAQTLAKDGHTVFATMRGIHGKNAEHAVSLSKWAKEKNADIRIVELDVVSDKSVNVAAAAILEQTGGKIDVIVNNAGIFGMGLQETFTANDYKNNFEVNVFGPARVNNAFLPAMRKQGSGLIIQISSVLGRVIVPFSGVYHATKFAVEALAENLSYELAPLGIESVLVQPGPFQTEIFGKGYVPENASLADDYGSPAEYLQRFSETFGGMMSGDVPNKPQQVADAIKKLVDLPAGQRPLRTVVDAMMDGTRQLNDAAEQVQKEILNGLGLSDLLSSSHKNELLETA